MPQIYAPKKLRPKEQIETEVNADKENIAMLKPIATVKETFRGLVEWFGLIFSRVVDQLFLEFDAGDATYRVLLCSLW